MIPSDSPLWQYLSREQRELATDADTLLSDAQLHPDQKLSDYSYIVFPVAKLYEGFLKELFFDLNIISDIDYKSDHFRIGKVLSPNMMRILGKRSAYRQLAHRFGNTLAENLWQTWKEARNLIFHYFPHNYRAINRVDAERLVLRLEDAMNEALEITRTTPVRVGEPSDQRVVFLGSSA